MSTLMGLCLWCLLWVVCWPAALLVIVLWPLVWLISLPFRLIGISVDSAFAHKAFRDQLGIDTSLLADFEPKGEVARAYGAYLDGAGHSNRSLVLIDGDGTVEWVHETATPLDIPGPDLITEAIK